MLQEIRKMRDLVENRKPYEREVYDLIHESNLIDLLYTGLRLNGLTMPRESIQKIIRGELVMNVPMENYRLADRYKKLLSEMKSMVEMDFELNGKLCKRLYELSRGESETSFRRTNPIIYQLDYNPPHSYDVEKLMTFLDGPEPGESNEILLALNIHNKIIEIYPYEEGSEELARLCLYYYLMSRGYPVFVLGFSEQEYNGGIQEYLKGRDKGLLYRGVERSLFNKLDYLLRLTDTEEK